MAPDGVDERTRRDGDKRLERRASTRLYRPCAVRVRGADVDGPFEQISFVDDVGSGGLFVRLTRRPDPGTKLAVVVSLPTGARVVARGCVVRLEPRGAGQWGIAMRFTRTRMGRTLATTS